MSQTQKEHSVNGYTELKDDREDDNGGNDTENHNEQQEEHVADTKSTSAAVPADLNLPALPRTISVGDDEDVKAQSKKSRKAATAHTSAGAISLARNSHSRSTSPIPRPKHRRASNPARSVRSSGYALLNKPRPIDKPSWNSKTSHFISQIRLPVWCSQVDRQSPKRVKTPPKMELNDRMLNKLMRRAVEAVELGKCQNPSAVQSLAQLVKILPHTADPNVHITVHTLYSQLHAQAGMRKEAMAAAGRARDIVRRLVKEGKTDDWLLTVEAGLDGILGELFIISQPSVDK